MVTFQRVLRLQRLELDDDPLAWLISIAPPTKTWSFVQCLRVGASRIHVSRSSIETKRMGRDVAVQR